MNGRVGMLVAVVLVLVTGAGPMVAAGGATDTGTAQPDSNPFQQDRIDADEVRMDVFVRSNGTAEWTVEFWVRLDDEESTAAFESLRDDIRNDPENHTQSFAERMNETAATASEATGREMGVDGFGVETRRQSLAREYGVVRYTFDWHGFAAVEDGEIRAGDAIEGIYLDDGTRLLFEWPEEYDLATVTPGPDDERDRAVIWRGGETEFVSGEPRVVLTAAGGGPGTAATAAGALVVLGLAAFGAWWYRTRRSTDGPREDGTPSAGSDSDGKSADGIETDVAGPEEAAGPGGESDAGDEFEPGNEPDAGDPSDEPTESSVTGAPEMELLSNEEQVIRLLETHGGRMKQQTVVEELGWTDAKTSKVVTGLREEGKLESFRLGRENVLSLPEAEEPGRATGGAGGESSGTGGEDRT